MSTEAPVALVTGASRGIGRAIALELAAAGFDVAVNFLRNEEAARDTARDVEARGRRALVCGADIALTSSHAGLLEAIRAAFGRIDLLVNNAGMAPQARADLLDATEASFDELLATNLRGPHFLTQAVARWMLSIRRDHPDRRLSVINISSLSEYTASVSRGEYCIAKAGLGMATRLWAARLAEHDIRVNEVRPGLIATDMTAAVHAAYSQRIAAGLTPIRRWGTPEDVARAVRALTCGDFDFCTALAVDIDRGFHLQRL